MTPGVETPVTGSKKITIHVGGSRGSAGASPAPQTGQSSDSGRLDGSMDNNRNILPPGAGVAGATFQLDKTRGLSASAASPSPSMASPMPRVAAQQSPAMLPKQNGNVPNGVPIAGQHLPQVPPAQQLQNGHPPAAPTPTPPLYDNKYRAPGRGGYPPATSYMDGTNAATRYLRCSAAKSADSDTSEHPFGP